MSMISGNAHRLNHKRGRAAIHILIVIFAFLLTGCVVDRSKETPPVQSQYKESATQVTQTIPSDNAESSPTAELTPDDTPIASEIKPSVPAPDNTPETEVTEQPLSEPADEDLVRVLDYIPSIYVDLEYATEDNFTGKVIYDFTDAYLRYGTIRKLMAVQTELTEQGYSLKIWDAYRPVSAQFTLWEVCPNPVYVATRKTQI